MPNAALATGCVEHAVPLALLSSALVAYAMAPGGAKPLDGDSTMFLFLPMPFNEHARASR
jgi:hypothetical protein